jgi:hypothetical protein
MIEIAKRMGSVCCFLGVTLSGLAVPGIALAQTIPATAPAPSTNGASEAGGASPAAGAVPPAPSAAPAPPAAAVSAQPVPPPAPPYAAPPPGYPGYPPPWPGYGYSYSPPPSFAAARLAVLDAQIRDLQARRDDITLALPIVLLVGGGVAGVLGLGIIAENICPKDEYGVRQDPSCVENRSSIDRGVGLVVVGAVGVAFGGTSLIIRTARRRHIARQIDARALEANALRPLVTPRWGVSPLRNGGGVVSLALDF